MVFFIVAESGIIEEACKAAKHPLFVPPWLKFMSTNSSLPGFFKFLTVSNNRTLLTASDLNLGLVRLELVLRFFNRLSEPNEENDRYSIIF